MSWGVRVKDGTVTDLDPHTNVGRFIGSVEISGDGSMTVPAFADGTPEPHLMPLGTHYWLPEISVSGTTLSWSYGSPPANSPGGTSPTPCILLLMVR